MYAWLFEADVIEADDPDTWLNGLNADEMYGLMGTSNGRVGINCKYWTAPVCPLCGKYCMITGVGAAKNEAKTIMIIVHK